MKKRAPQLRFRDDGRSLFRYLDDILVTCPKCGGNAHVTPSDPPPAGLPVASAFAPRRLVCPGCTHRAAWSSDTMGFNRFAGGAARDPYFGLPLRLQTPTRHGVLFAYNSDHLGWIEGYVAAGLRERRVEDGRANRSIASRLPQWVKRAGNRAEVVRAIARLRRGLAD